MRFFLYRTPRSYTHNCRQVRGGRPSPFAFYLCLSALICGCFLSVSYASPPPSAEVHFCLPLNAEDMRARDSIYDATKHALNLNVGEPRTVRMIYFLPNDRPFRQEVVDSMKVTIRQIQTFFAEQMQAHGYGNKTFRFETDLSAGQAGAEGEPVVHRVDGQHPDSHYLDNTSSTVFDEIQQDFDLDANIYFIVIDNSINAIDGAAGRGDRRGKNGGVALFPGEFSFETAAHELGHAFGLWHDFDNDAYVMSYGGVHRDRLSACNAEFLAIHPYFNPDTPTEEAQPPTIELISPAGYPAGSKSISIQLKVNDSEGLHQVILFVRTREPHPAVGFFELKTCRGLAGEKDTVVEFDYDGVIPSVTETSLSNPSVHPILQERGVEVLFDQPTTLVRISEGEQEGVPGAVLGTPLVVEVRDQDGNVLAGAPVAFAVTAGDGSLSVETTVTDSSGRASSVLTLGNSLEPIVVSVMVAGIDQAVMFSVAAVATLDFDGNGAVGFADFLLFVAQFGFSEDDEGYKARFDLDGDGTIGFGDFLLLANAFGKEVSSLGVSGG